MEVHCWTRMKWTTKWEPTRAGPHDGTRFLPGWMVVGDWRGSDAKAVEVRRGAMVGPVGED